LRLALASTLENCSWKRFDWADPSADRSMPGVRCGLRLVVSRRRPPRFPHSEQCGLFSRMARTWKRTHFVSPSRLSTWRSKRRMLLLRWTMQGHSIGSGQIGWGLVFLQPRPGIPAGTRSRKLVTSRCSGLGAAHGDLPEIFQPARLRRWFDIWFPTPLIACSRFQPEQHLMEHIDCFGPGLFDAAAAPALDEWAL